MILCRWIFSRRVSLMARFSIAFLTLVVAFLALIDACAQEKKEGKKEVKKAATGPVTPKSGRVWYPFYDFKVGPKAKPEEGSAAKQIEDLRKAAIDKNLTSAQRKKAREDLNKLT